MGEVLVGAVALVSAGWLVARHDRYWDGRRWRDRDD